MIPSVRDRAQAGGAAGAAPGPVRPLPPLDEVVARIPAPVRAAMDELLRARFTGVRAFPEGAAVRPQTS